MFSDTMMLSKTAASTISLHCSFQILHQTEHFLHQSHQAPPHNDKKSRNVISYNANNSPCCMQSSPQSSFLLFLSPHIEGHTIPYTKVNFKEESHNIFRSKYSLLMTFTVSKNLSPLKNFVWFPLPPPIETFPLALTVHILV